MSILTIFIALILLLSQFFRLDTLLFPDLVFRLLDPHFLYLTPQVGKFDLAIKNASLLQFLEVVETLLHLRHLPNMYLLQEFSDMLLNHYGSVDLLIADVSVRPFVEQTSVPLLDDSDFVKHLLHFKDATGPVP